VLIVTSSSSSATATQRQTHWAIAIGIGQYPLLPPLPEAETNAVMVARAWQAMAEHQRRCLVLSDRSLPVLDRPTYPNRENLEYWLDRLTTELIQPGDTIWCFFSGYGATYRDRDYLLPIEASFDRVATAGIPLRRICEYLKLASDRVGPTGQVLALFDLSRPPQETLPFVGNDVPLLAQEMGLSVVLAEPGTGSTSSGLLAPALVTALGQSQTMNLYALVRFLRETTRDRAQQLGQVPPQIQVFAHPHERLYATVLGRSRPEPPLSQGSFVVFPASPVELQGTADPEPSDVAIAPATPSTAQTEGAIDPNPALDRLADEALDRFAAEAELPAAPSTWAAEPSAFETVFAASATPEPEPTRSLPTASTVRPVLPPLTSSPEPVTEPIPESRRDLATPPPVPAIVHAVLSAGDQRFARQLVLWGGVMGIILLAAAIARNYAELIGSGWSDSQTPPAVTTPLPAPANGAAPPTGTAIAPAAGSPSPVAAAPTPSPVAPASPVAAIGTPPANGSQNVAQLVQAARSEIAVGQFQKALNWLAKVPPNAQTPEIQKLRSDAIQGRDRNLLGLARVPIGTNQASEFGKAILRARQIKPGDPGYGQAQESIDRWSRVILDLATGRAQNGDFAGAIAAAKIVAADRGEIYKEARAAIGQWQALQQQQANNRALLQKAASQIQTGQASSYNRAIDIARVIPATQPGFAAARDQINLWSQEILNLARTRANGKQWAAAIQTAALVPPGTAAYASAQQAIAQWQKQPR
jgi:hypothetical protein